MRKITTLLPALFFILSFSATMAQSPGDIVIVEIMRNPSTVQDSMGEWFEIYNATSNTIDINGWIIKDKDFDVDTINNGGPLNIAPCSYFVLGSNANPAQNGNYTCNYRYNYANFKIANTPDEMILKTAAGVTIDSVGFTMGAAWPNPVGSTMVFTGLPSQDNQDSTLWGVAALRQLSFGSPGTDKGSPGTRGTTQPVSGTSLSHVASNVSCFGANDGSIDLTVLGCAAPFTYSWNPGGATSQDISGLAPNTYIVTVTDASTNVFQDTITITEPSAFSNMATTTMASCPTLMNGAIDLMPMGGTAPYSYSWSNGATSEDLTGLAPGSYTVTVTDARGCTTIGSYSVGQMQFPPTATHTVTNAGCPNFTNGAVDLTVTGGSGPYTYLWSNTATSQDISGLLPNTYIATITDQNNCVIRDTSVVGITSGSVSLSFAVVHEHCPAYENGSINTTLTGGTAPFNFSWSHGPVTQNLSGLSTNWYHLTVTDGSGCVRVDSAYVDSIPFNLSVSAVVTNVSCSGLSDGAIDVTASGGTAPLSYSWASGPASADRSNLAAGVYYLTITDDSNCSVTDTFSVTQPNALSVDLDITNVSCNGSGDGAIVSTVLGGSGSHTYLWSNSAVTANLSGLTAGTYSVTVTDSAGCEGTDTATIIQPLTLTVSGSGTPVTTSANGTASASASGGIPPYTYNWTPGGGTSSSLTGLSAGVYTVEVTDSNGCTGTDTVHIDSLFNNRITGITGDFGIYPNPASSEITLQLPEGLSFPAALRILDLRGAVLIEENISTRESRIKLNGFASGTYLVELISGEERTVKRLVIKN